MLTKSIKTEIKANTDKREIEGYAALFDDLDGDNDIIKKGAFTKTLSTDVSRVKVLWQHNQQAPIGKPYIMSEDSKGLHFKARLTKGVQLADEALALIHDGVIDEMSFGFDTVEAEHGSFESKNVRFLKELRLWEISPVTWGANGNTTIAAKELSHIIDTIKAGRVLSQRNLTTIMEAISKQEESLKELRNVVDSAMTNREDNDNTPENEQEEQQKSLQMCDEILVKAADRLDELIKKGA